MTRSAGTWSVVTPAALLAAAGVVLAIAPSMTALGKSGPPEHYPGSILDLKPVYGSFLIASGVTIAVLALVIAWRRSPAPALLAGALAIVSGLSLRAVDVVIDNPVIYRSYSVFSLRGTAPWTAALACLTALLIAVVLVAVLTVYPQLRRVDGQPAERGRRPRPDQDSNLGPTP